MPNGNTDILEIDLAKHILILFHDIIISFSLILYCIVHIIFEYNFITEFLKRPIKVYMIQNLFYKNFIK